MTTKIFENMIHDMMDMLLEKAKANRESFKYSGDEQFVQVAVLIKSNLKPVVMPIAFQNAAEKRKNMWALSATARITKAPAALMISDCRWAHSDKLVPVMGLPSIEKEGIEKFQDEYHRILAAKYDGQIKNLPRECWSEALVVVAKGPELPVTTRFAPYEEGPGDSIRWLPRDLMPTPNVELWPMLPDWWVQ